MSHQDNYDKSNGKNIQQATYPYQGNFQSNTKQTANTQGNQNQNQLKTIIQQTSPINSLKVQPQQQQTNRSITNPDSRLSISSSNSYNHTSNLSHYQPTPHKQPTIQQNTSISQGVNSSLSYHTNYQHHEQSSLQQYSKEKNLQNSQSKNNPYLHSGLNIQNQNNHITNGLKTKPSSRPQSSNMILVTSHGVGQNQTNNYSNVLGSQQNSNVQGSFSTSQTNNKNQIGINNQSENDQALKSLKFKSSLGFAISTTPSSNLQTNKNSNYSALSHLPITELQSHRSKQQSYSNFQNNPHISRQSDSLISSTSHNHTISDNQKSFQKPYGIDYSPKTQKQNYKLRQLQSHQTTNNISHQSNFSLSKQGNTSNSLNSNITSKVINASPKQRRRKIDNLLKQVDEILMFQPVFVNHQTASSPHSIFTTKRNTITQKFSQQMVQNHEKSDQEVFQMGISTEKQNQKKRQSMKGMVQSIQNDQNQKLESQIEEFQLSGEQQLDTVIDDNNYIENVNPKSINKKIDNQNKTNYNTEQSHINFNDKSNQKLTEQHYPLLQQKQLQKLSFEIHSMENVDEEQLPLEQEPHAYIEPPLYFETRINDKQHLLQLAKSQEPKTFRNQDLEQKSGQKSHRLLQNKNEASLFEIVNNVASSNSNSGLDSTLKFRQSKHGNATGEDRDLISGNFWYDTLTSGSQTERRKGQNNNSCNSNNNNRLMYQKFVNFKEQIDKKENGNIQNSKNGGGLQKIINIAKVSKMNNNSLQSQLITNSSTQITKNIKQQQNSTLLSMNNQSLISKKTLKVSLHGANLHYCSKKDGDLEEDKILPTGRGNDASSPLENLNIQFENEDSSDILSYNSDSSPSKKMQEFFQKTGSTTNLKNYQEQIKSKNIMKVIISYTTMTETINIQNLNKKIRNDLIKEITKHQRYLIINTGLTRIERIRLWYNKTSMIEAKHIQKGQLPNLYRRLAKKTSKFNSEILIDAERTFPHILLFGNKERAQDMLVRILNAVANQIPDLGYFQGMNSIALSLLLILQNEEDTFYMMIQLLQKFKLKDMYLNNFDQLRLLCFQLDCFMKAYLPELYDIFETQNIDSEYFATKWFLTLFTFDLSIEVISTVLDLFMVEGYKSLIKIALAILDYALKIFNEGHFVIHQYSSKNETFVDVLKHFSEELRVDSHHLLCQAQNFKVTSKLMKDMEKLYIKESKPRRRKHERGNEQHARVVEEKIRSCRSYSLKNRMLLITQDRNNKYEWRILPQLPSKLNPQEEVSKQQNIQNFEQFLETFEVSFSNNNMIQKESSIVLSPSDKNDIISIFSECEEIKGSDEKGINTMLSHKKPYASRMVMSNKKQKSIEDRVIPAPTVFKYNCKDDDSHSLRKQTMILKIQQRKQNANAKVKDQQALVKTSSLKAGLGLLSENVGAESRIDFGIPQNTNTIKEVKKPSKKKNSADSDVQKTLSNRKTITSDRDHKKLEGNFETIKIESSPKQQNFKKFKERFTKKHQFNLQPTPKADSNKKKKEKNVSQEKTIIKTKQNFTKPAILNYNSTQSNLSNFNSNSDSTTQIVSNSKQPLNNQTQNGRSTVHSANFSMNNHNNFLSSSNIPNSHMTSNSALNSQFYQNRNENSQKIVKQKSTKQLQQTLAQISNSHSSLNHHSVQQQQVQQAPTQSSQPSQFHQLLQQSTSNNSIPNHNNPLPQQNQLSNKKQPNQVSLSLQLNSIQQHLKLAQQARKSSNKSTKGGEGNQDSKYSNGKSNMSASAIMVSSGFSHSINGGIGNSLNFANGNILKTQGAVNQSLEFDSNALQHQITLEFDINNEDHQPITNVKIPRSKIKLTTHMANGVSGSSSQGFSLDSPKLNKINPIKLRQKFDEESFDRTNSLLPFQIKNLDTGEISSMDPFIKFLEQI